MKVIQPTKEFNWKSMSGKVDVSFAHYLLSNYDISIETPQDVIDLLSIYSSFITDYASPDVADEEVIYRPLHFPIRRGFNLLYGPPDSLKTTIGIWIANWFIKNTDFSVVYVDAENKYSHTMIPLHDQVLLLPGRNQSHNMLRKLITRHLVNVVVVDTICTLSRYSDFLRTTIKRVDVQNLYIILLNQTRNWRFGMYSAGLDIIEHVSVAKHRIVSANKKLGNVYAKTDSGYYFVKSQDGSYNEAESLRKMLMLRNIITKIGRHYYYNSELIQKNNMQEKLKEILSENQGIIEPFRGFVRESTI